MPSGTAIQVKVNEAISTETANVGDAWSGTVENAVTEIKKKLAERRATTQN